MSRKQPKKEEDMKRTTSRAEGAPGGGGGGRRRLRRLSARRSLGSKHDAARKHGGLAAIVGCHLGLGRVDEDLDLPRTISAGLLGLWERKLGDLGRGG